MRTYKWSKRELTNAVLYFVKTGCQWGHLPHDFPPYWTVHSFYRRARLSGLWEKILRYLVKTSRERAGRKAEPSYAIIDSQSVKATGAAKERGIDGGKHERQEAAHRRRHIGKSAGGGGPCRKYPRYKGWDHACKAGM